jgi:hypothetical protein
MNLPYCIIAEAVKREMETVASHIPVIILNALYRYTYWRVFRDEPALLHHRGGGQAGNGDRGLAYSGNFIL